MRAKYLAVLVLCFAVGKSLAQKPGTTLAGRHISRDPLPTVKLAWVEDPNGPQMEGAQVVFAPIGSAPDGTLFLHTTQPPNLQQSSLMSVANGHHDYSVTNFALEKISDLHDVRLKAYYATESIVAMLVSATKDDALSTEKHTTLVPSTGEHFERSVKSGERHDYIVTFDRQGNYKEAAVLDVPFRVEKVAVFNSGTLLVIGYDADRKTKLAFVNADGTLQRMLDTDEAMRGSDKTAEALGRSQSLPAEVQAKMPPPVGLAQFLTFHDKLLMVWPGTTWILDISPGGAVRRVAIRVPEGSVIDHFIPSSGQAWYVSFRRYGASTNEDQGTVFYEANPLTGSLVRRFETGTQFVSEIACEHDGEFRAIGLSYGKELYKFLNASH